MNDAAPKASSFRKVDWPAQQTGACVEMFATVACLDGAEVFLGAASMESLRLAYDFWVDGKALFDPERVQHILVAQATAP